MRCERLRAQRARPRAGQPRAQRPGAQVGRRGARTALPVRAAEPRRGSARRGRALPRPGRPRHQAAPARTGVPRQQSEARGRLRARARTAPAGAHPRGPRPSAGHAARARARRRAAPRRLADPGARRDRGAGRHRQARAERREHLFDSSTWTPLDQLNLLSLVPPERSWASDIPYGEPLAALNVFARSARVSGAGDDLLRGMLRDNALGLLEGRRPERRSAPLPTRSSAPRTRASAPPCIWRAPPRYSGWACRTRRILGLAEAALHEDGLDDHAPSSYAAPAPSGTSGQRRSCRARRPISSGAAACGGCSTRPRPTRCWRERGHGRAQRARVARKRSRRCDARRGAARPGRPHGHEDRLCRGDVRRMHGARRRRATLSCILLAAQADGGDVRTVEGLCVEGSCRRCSGVHRGGRAPVRVLHAWPGRLGDGAARREPEAGRASRCAPR